MRQRAKTIMQIAEWLNRRDQAAEAGELAPRRPRRQLAHIVYVISRDPLALFSVVIIATFALVAILGPWLAPYPEQGYGKRTVIEDYRLQKRGGSGIKTGKVTPKTGLIVAAKILSGEEDLIVISQKGQVIRTVIGSIPKLSRATQGVRIMRLDQGDRVASATCI